VQLAAVDDEGVVVVRVPDAPRPMATPTAVLVVLAPLPTGGVIAGMETRTSGHDNPNRGCTGSPRPSPEHNP
jgi:hypothetical protein